MARQCLQRCLRAASRQGTRYYSSKSNELYSVAKLLESSPSASDVAVNGFIRSIRNQKTRSFAAIGDGSSLEPLQALLTPAQAERSIYQFFSHEMMLILLQPDDWHGHTAHGRLEAISKCKNAKS
jgi:hypothetical protein